MNQYQLQNAAFKVDGYYIAPRDKEHVERQFKKAQAECAKHLREDLERLESMTLEQFLRGRKIGAPCARPTGPNGEPCGITARPCPDCGLALHGAQEGA